MGYALGSVYTRRQINEALASSTPEERFALVPSRDVTGHGTAVLGIAAGNGRSSADAAMQGVAPEATLVVVKLGNPDPADLPADIAIAAGGGFLRKICTSGGAAACD